MIIVNYKIYVFRRITKKIRPDQTSALTFELHKPSDKSVLEIVKRMLRCNIQHLINKMPNTALNTDTQTPVLDEDCSDKIEYSESYFCIEVRQP